MSLSSQTLQAAVTRCNDEGSDGDPRRDGIINFGIIIKLILF